jgi:hypothetical protein
MPVCKGDRSDYLLLISLRWDGVTWHICHYYVYCTSNRWRLWNNQWHDWYGHTQLLQKTCPSDTLTATYLI